MDIIENIKEKMVWEGIEQTLNLAITKYNWYRHKLRIDLVDKWEKERNY